MTMRRAQLVVARDQATLAKAAAAELRRRAAEAISSRGRFTVALAGGSTPRALFLELADGHARGARPRLDDPRIHWFWSDERAVAPDHPESNFGLAWNAIFEAVRPPTACVHRIEAEADDLEQSARAYEATIERVLESNGMRPVFDVIWLGLGSDGHVASLFPESPAVFEARRHVVVTQHPQTGAARFTFTLPLINAARAVIFLVAGEGKRPVLARLLAPEIAGEPLPANLVQPENGDLLCFVDAEAAGAPPDRDGP